MRTLRLLPLLLGLLVPLAAQAQPAAPEPVRLRFLFLDETDGSYAVKTGPATLDLGARPYVISAPVEFAPGADIELLKNLPDAATGAPRPASVLSHKVPAGMPHALAVIAPSTAKKSDGSPDYRVRFYDIAPDKSPARSIRILNLSPATLAARLGDTRVEVASGAQTVAQPAFDQRDRVRGFIAVRAGGDWRMIFNSFLSLPKNARMTGVAVYSASGMRHTYTEQELAVLGQPAPGVFWLSFSDTL